MIRFSIESNSTLFYSEFHVLWNNILTDRKKNSGFFVSNTLEEAIAKIKYMIRQQTAVCLSSFVNERRWVYTHYWKTTTTRQENLKYEYCKLLEKVELFCISVYKFSFEELMAKLYEMSNTILMTLTPGKDRRGQETIKNKVDKIRRFSGSIINYLNNPIIIEKDIF